MTLPKSIELQWQKEVIERWVEEREITSEGRKQLLEMLRVVTEQLDDLSAGQQNVAR